MVHGKGWKEEMEGGNDVIIFSYFNFKTKILKNIYNQAILILDIFHHLQPRRNKITFITEL